jgi:hypothetical protein
VPWPLSSRSEAGNVSGARRREGHKSWRRLGQGRVGIGLGYELVEWGLGLENQSELGCEMESQLARVGVGVGAGAR